MFKITEDGIFNFYANGDKKEYKYTEKDFPVMLPPLYSSPTDCMCDQMILENLGYKVKVKRHPILNDYIIIIKGINNNN